MAYKRILTIQDISCVGQCSMTVALPILSACGHETCIFPTAVLSTHTGGFGKPAVVHLNEQLEAMVDHWKCNDITFDAILVGYLGSTAAIDIAQRVIGTMLAPGGISIVDPAMADHGKRYSGLDEAYARKMEQLCRIADIMMPNLTEAAMFAGYPYCPERIDADYYASVLTALDHPCVILTGSCCDPSKTGAAIWENGRLSFVSHDRVEQSFHGTGDMFAACFTGALMQGLDLVESSKLAGDFVLASIENTVKAPVHWYGVKFETALPMLIQKLEERKTAV